ncbi:TPA: phage virion morphogenesis protein [Pseudomonas aeruginosa]|nr:phage virion morphogenesis protein [Pseudomonas aeruginosa]
MAASRALNLDVRGLLDVKTQLELVALPPKLRIRLLNRVTLRLRAQWRQRVRDQRDVKGAAFEPRKRKTKRPAKALGGLAKQLSATRVTQDSAELGWRSRKAAMVARVHNEGHTFRMTAAAMRRQRKAVPTTASRHQAKRLRHLGFKVRLPGKGKRKKPRWMKPSVAWIQENIGYAQAGLLIRVLADEAPGPTSWNIELPRRQFFGPENPEEVARIFAHVLPQILKSPR